MAGEEGGGGGGEGGGNIWIETIELGKWEEVIRGIQSWGWGLLKDIMHGWRKAWKGE